MACKQKNTPNSLYYWCKKLESKPECVWNYRLNYHWTELYVLQHDLWKLLLSLSQICLDVCAVLAPCRRVLAPSSYGCTPPTPPSFLGETKLSHFYTTCETKQPVPLPNHLTSDTANTERKYCLAHSKNADDKLFLTLYGFKTRGGLVKTTIMQGALHLHKKGNVISQEFGVQLGQF